MPSLESSADKAYMLDLPKVSFRVITDDEALLGPAGVHSEQSRTYGYNNFELFERPEHYIRYIEPIESELAVQVEYDMDEQDQAWLDAVNNERKKEQSDQISYEVFEIIMDKLEKEWFDLIKRIPQPASHLPVEDSKCSICDDGEGENSNAIVFCDGCNLAVHQDCYGVPYIPEGQWLCRKCTVSPENPVSCLFCPNEGGAFKQTTTGHWSHLLCAIWIPELGVGNQVYMEPVEGVEMVPKNRWKLVCSLCRERVGACIQCDNRNCFTAFHVTCARQLGLLMNMKSMTTDGVLRAFCEKHLPADSKADDDSENESDASDSSPRKSVMTQDRVRRRSRGGSHNLLVPVTTKSARAHAKSYRPGPPLVPNMIVKRLLDYVSKISIRKRQVFIERLCRYWSLKREARRGAPLLKRLHLEPWTASNAARQESEAEKAQKMKFLAMLRNDLEKVRMLAELARKREKEKLHQAQLLKDVVDNFIFPQYARLRQTLEKISAVDRQGVFAFPVSKVEVPDYYEVVKEPRSWNSIDEQLEQHGYRNVAEFKRDIMLVVDNAILYNAPDTHFHRLAMRIRKVAPDLLAELDDISLSDSADAASDLPGDLESSIPLLQALSHHQESAAHDLLASIFAFEMEKPAPPRSPSPPPPPPKKKQSETERKQRWAEKEARAKERLPGAGRGTRAAEAHVKAFEHEAGIQDSLAASGSRSSRKTRPGPSKMENISEEGEISPAKDGVRPHSKPQRGVVGFQTLAVLSDKERRERERQMDLVAANVDAKDEFTRFNIGWVLPEGSKRRRAERPESANAPTSVSRRKKASTVDENIIVEESRPRRNVSISSGSLTPPPSSSVVTSIAGSVTRTRAGKRNTATPSQVGTPTAPSRRSEKRRASTIDSVIIFDDTPAKRPRNRLTELQASAGRSSSRKGSPASKRSPMPRKLVKEARVVLYSDTDEEALTPEPEEEVEAVEELEPVGLTMADEEVKQATPEGEGMGTATPSRGKTAKSDKKKKSSKQAPAIVPDREELSDSEDPYPLGAMVWARVDSFPYFPGRVVDPDSTTLAKSVLAVRPTQDQPRHWLINFYDTTSTFGWVAASKIDLLGVGQDIDDMYLAGNERGRRKGFKNKHIASLTRKAYRLAVGESGSPGADGPNERAE